MHEAINLQQTYTTSLCSHINTICSKLVQLEKQIQTHCLYPHSQTDVVQINAPEYDLDINRQLDIRLLVPSHVNNTQEPAPVTTNSDEDSMLPQDSDQFEPQPKPDQIPAEHQNTETVSEQDDRLPSLEDMLELEEEEDWEDGHFVDTDLIDHHNMTQESARIRCEYSTHFQKLSQEEHHYQQHTTPGFDYYIPEPDYYNSDTKPKQYKKYQNPNIYLPPLPSTEDLRRWHGRSLGRVRSLELHSHRLFGKKTRSLESRIAQKGKKNL